MNVAIDPADFAPLIEAAVEAAIRRLLPERPVDAAGKVLLDKRAAAEVLSVSISTVDRLRRDAGLPCVKLSGAVLFQPESLRAWAAAREDKAP